MMKKIFAIGLVCFSFMAHSVTPEQEETMQASRRAYFKSQGMEYPTPGVHVVPSNAIQLPTELKQQVMINQQTSLQKGYVENKNQRILEVRDIHHTAVYEKQKHMNDPNPENTDLKNTVSEMKMAYDFKEVPAQYANNVIGFAAAGTYVNQGWTGILEIFTKKDFGNCFYEENNLSLSKGSIRIPENQVTHTVNGKITTSHVEGNKKDGFLYTVEWYDEALSHKLECVTKTSSKLSTVIAMAKGIDH
jgi:hypothetical protein